MVLHGSGAEKIKFVYDDNARKYEVSKPFEGVLPNLERRWRETDSAWVREELGRYQSETPCEACGGKRLKPEALAEAMAAARQGGTFRMQKGYDHSYFFVSSFMEDHVHFHADAHLG